MDYIKEQYALEESLEKSQLDSYLRDMQKAIVQGSFQTTPEGTMLMKLGFFPLKGKIEEFFVNSYRKEYQKNKLLLQLLCDDNSSVLAYCILSTIVGKAYQKGYTATAAAKDIMKNLSHIVIFSTIKKNDPKLYSYINREYSRASKRRKREIVEENLKTIRNFDYEGLANSTAVKLGAICLDLLIKSGSNLIKLNKEVIKGKKKSTIVLTKDAQEVIFENINQDFILSKTSMLPMVCPPKDWTSINKGGYLKHKVPLIKYSSNKQRKYLLRQDLSGVLEGINKLQRTPWRVNTRVLDVMKYIYNNNLVDPLSPKTLPKCYGGIPTSTRYTCYDLVDIPDDIKEYHTGFKNYFSGYNNFTKSMKASYAKYRRDLERTQIELDADVSRNLSHLLTINAADKMKKYESIYFVYQFDYRGRVYVNSEYLHPQTKSNVRALLEFSEAHYLTERGKKYLKIHIANTYGKDKEELEDRIAFVDENKDMLLRVATEPLRHLNDWVYTDSPYEFLGACMAFKDALEGKPIRIPIELDATCSGIQMYSGLLRDREGGLCVNIVGNTRQDIYQKVADKVIEYLKKGEYPKTVTFKNSEGVTKTLSTVKEANSLIETYSRSICKRNVMTTPYSVTLRGMSDQNREYIHQALIEGKVFWIGDSWIVNKLITDLNYKAIGEVVKGARLGQEFLRDVADRLKREATWKTPIFKFPVYQPAHRKKAVRVRTPIGNLSVLQEILGVDNRKQKNMIAANFIHSLDATVLLYCVMGACFQLGCIHDCFLVHPNDGDEIVDLYKEGFIEVMSRDPLRLLKEQLFIKDLEVPCIGTLDLNEVRESKYILS